MGRLNTITKLGCVLLGSAALFPLTSGARYHYSGNKCDHSLRDYIGVGVCGDRMIPAGRRRAARNFALECTAEGDPYMRSMVKMTPEAFKEWKPLEERSRRKTTPNSERYELLAKMHEIRLKEPVITWSGIISYQTIETWTWTSCEEHQSAFHCGTHQDEKTCYRDVPAGTDKDGRTIYRSEPYTCYETHANNCHYDENEHEAVACSTEVMDYKLTYAKPDATWHPVRNDAELAAETKVEPHLRYHPIIPNKYDLLPGEFENVVAMSNSSRSTSVTPTVQVGDAWNKYSHTVRFSNGGSSASCRYNTRYKIDITMHTLARDNTRQTPNAFRFPTDDKGNPKDPFKYFSTADSDSSLVKVRPSHLRVVDASNGVLKLMSKQMSANRAALEKVKQDQGLGKAGSVPSAKEAEDQGLFKDTQMRIMVIEKNYTFGVDALARDMRRTVNLYGGGDKLLTLDGDNYNVSLDEEGTRLYRASAPWPLKSFAENNIDIQLKPNTEYLYMVSMYQANVPFYAQKGQKNVRWREFFKGEESYFSKPLVIKLNTPKVETRNFLNRILDY